MHGCHQLKDECQISAERLDLLLPKKSSSSSFRFRRTKLKSESSPKCCSTGGYLKKMAALVTAAVLLILGLMRSVGTSNMLKCYGGVQLILAYLTPKLLVVKRSPVVDNGIENGKILEIVPVPLHLILALGNVEVAERILSKDPTSQLIIPHATTFNTSLSSRIITESNSTSIFESLSFALCKSYLKNKRHPTRLTITGAPSISKCVQEKSRKAFKFPKSMVSFISTNSSSLPVNCTTENDYFDCRHLNNRDHRVSVRQRYSDLCPDLAPLLLACGNRLTMKRALTYKPPWSRERERILTESSKINNNKS